MGVQKHEDSEYVPVEIMCRRAQTNLGGTLLYSCIIGPTVMQGKAVEKVNPSSMRIIRVAKIMWRPHRSATA